ncbi:hypothetical protein Zm00014a_018962 [Zea mays]|uniref:Uncharacterized protein n=1 Tax=Zea mays TaxID=4577 RepID=A0A3L6FC95_MAIZE|nr:hypothetical protein Zm00014a_018962 [Zea mays]
MASHSTNHILPRSPVNSHLPNFAQKPMIFYVINILFAKSCENYLLAPKVYS